MIDLQQAPLPAAPPVIGAKRAAALITNVHIARDSGRDMASAFHPFGCSEAARRLRSWSFRSGLGLSRSRANEPRLPADAKPLFNNSLRSASSPRFITRIRSPLG